MIAYYLESLKEILFCVCPILLCVLMQETLHRMCGALVKM